MNNFWISWTLYKLREHILNMENIFESANIFFISWTIYSSTWTFFKIMGSSCQIHEHIFLNLWIFWTPWTTFRMHELIFDSVNIFHFWPYSLSMWRLFCIREIIFDSINIFHFHECMYKQFLATWTLFQTTWTNLKRKHCIFLNPRTCFWTRVQFSNILNIFPYPLLLVNIWTFSFRECIFNL
jgi:hypothetical protein